MSSSESPANRTRSAATAIAVVCGALALSCVLLPSSAPPWQGLLGIGLAAAAGAAAIAAGRGTSAQAARAAANATTAAAADGARHAAYWQAIIDTATEGIVTIDARGHIETLNGAAERLFGYTPAEVVGKNVAMLMPEPFRSEHDGYLRRYLTTGERRIIGIGREVVGLHKNGRGFPIDLSVGEGDIAGRRFFTAVIRDITDRKAMQTKLAQTERLAAVGELAAGVAHEVNNPINTMINCAQLIVDGDDAAENCRTIIEEGQRIADIVQSLLQFARDDRGGPQPTPLVDVVLRTLRLVKENLHRHGITLQNDVPEGLPAILARPPQLQQVLLNLLINAKDALASVPPHTRPNGRRITITAAPRDGGVELTVADNGPGVPAELGTRIFEPFVTTKRARGGTGLGLSISKGIIEAWNGRISLDAERAADSGATFRVWLPFAEAAE